MASVRVTLCGTMINFMEKEWCRCRGKSSFSFGKKNTARFMPKSLEVLGAFAVCWRQMGPGLQLSQRLTQSLVLAPQLQQSLALLQAPTLELKALVEQELQQNPVLEEVADQDMEQREKSSESNDGDEADSPEPTDFAEPPEDVQFDSATEKPSADPVDDFQAEFDKLVQMDQDWRDHFSQTNTVVRSSSEDEEKREFMFNSITAETSLAQHL